MTKKQTRRRSQAAPPPPSRRLPAPRLPPGSSRRGASPPPAAPASQPEVDQIVVFIEQMAILSGLQKFVLLKDWIGMIDSSLQRWPDNIRSMALEGAFSDDPPEIEAIFSQARERYLHVSQNRPAVYRRMQESFAEAFTLLLESAAPGLEPYLDQPALNPDIIGQVFTTCLRPRPASPWWVYFPAWPDALAVAQAAIPNGHDLVYSALAEAARSARSAGPSVTLDPGVNFPEWFESVWPYAEPLRIGPPLVDSGARLLAAALQFPAWTLQAGLVKFTWAGALDHPLVKQMISLSAMLYGLNGYLLAHHAAWVDIQAHLRTLPETPPPLLPPPWYQDPPPDDQTPASPDQEDSAPGRSFADLFRKKPGS